jgi:hypothetical protein
MPRALSTLGGLVIVGFAAAISLFLASTQHLYASDLVMSPQLRTAALSGGQTRPSQRQVRDEASDQLDWLLAQGLPVTAAQGNSQTILAGFPLSTPESVEEDVRRQYGLELVRRFTIEPLDKRIVVFRVPDARAPSDVLAALKSDPRVSNAQLNAIYELPKQEPSAPQIGELKQAPAPKEEKGRASRPDRKVNLSSRGEAKPESRSDAAPATRPAKTNPPSGQQAALTTRSQGALRWPTADEPFVNVGMTNR